MVITVAHRGTSNESTAPVASNCFEPGGGQAWQVPLEQPKPVAQSLSAVQEAGHVPAVPSHT
jgi:hypothetical protein